ncbi:MAG: ATP-binding protein, partial [Pseudomonadales bacterium]|nr:ATP-binding protein [Pseudomonadales bacterium]
MNIILSLKAGGWFPSQTRALCCKLFLSLILLCFAVVSGANESNSFAKVAYLIDEQGTYSVDELLRQSTLDWVDSDSPYLNLGFMDDVVWVKFTILPDKNAGAKYFELANQRITDMTLYVAQEEGSQWRILETFQTSESIPISERIYPHRFFVFPIQTSSTRATQLLIRIENQNPMKLIFNLWELEDMHQQDMKRMLFQGIYFGTVMIMALYNLCIYFFVKDRSYATYVMFIFVFALIVAIDKGLAAQYLWPDYVAYDFQLYLVITALGAACSVLFTDHFLSLQENAPKLRKGLRALMYLWLCVAFVALFQPSIWVLILEMLILLPGGVALIFAGILMWRRGVAAAPYYTIAWVMIVLGVVIYASYLLGIWPYSLITEYALQVGNMFEATLLSLGLAYRIKKLDEENRTANALSQAKSEFLATMSHEIRTPMNGILGMAQLLKDTRLSQQQAGYLSTILGSGQTLLTVLNDILDYSKIEAGKLDIEKIDFNIRRLVDETASVFAVKATEKNLYYNTYVAPKVPIKIKGDPTRVRQILTNFLSNAFKFTASGQVLVLVERLQDSNQLCFKVRDTGIGIPLAKQRTVFQEFTQVDSSTSRQYGGTGLGLPISKRLVEMMGGEIGIRSEEGKGAEFWFTLPIVDEIPFDRVPDTDLAKKITETRFLQISPDRGFPRWLRDYADIWGFQCDFLQS